MNKAFQITLRSGVIWTSQFVVKLDLELYTRCAACLCICPKKYYTHAQGTA